LQPGQVGPCGARAPADARGARAPAGIGPAYRARSPFAQQARCGARAVARRPGTDDMNAPTPIRLLRSPSPERSRLAQRLRRVLRGDVLFDAASRGRYSTDASI